MEVLRVPSHLYVAGLKVRQLDLFLQVWLHKLTPGKNKMMALRNLHFVGIGEKADFIFIFFDISGVRCMN